MYEKTPAMRISLTVSAATLVGIAIIIIRRIKLIEIEDLKD